MDQIPTENYSITSEKESLSEFRRNYLQAEVLPSILLPESYRGKAEKVFYPEYTRKAKALLQSEQIYDNRYKNKKGRAIFDPAQKIKSTININC